MIRHSGHHLTVSIQSLMVWVRSENTSSCTISMEMAKRITFMCTQS